MTPEGRVVVVVEETGSVASEEEREHTDRAEYAAQREQFRKEWEANLVRAGEHIRTTIRSSANAEHRTHTAGRRFAERHRCLDHDGPLRAKEAA
jgi:hypothetical protein